MIQWLVKPTRVYLVSHLSQQLNERTRVRESYQEQTNKNKHEHNPGMKHKMTVLYGMSSWEG
jgi:hypothetical protein